MVFRGDGVCGIMLSNVLLLLYVRVCIPFVLYVHGLTGFALFSFMWWFLCFWLLKGLSFVF